MNATLWSIIKPMLEERVDLQQRADDIRSLLTALELTINSILGVPPGSPMPGPPPDDICVPEGSWRDRAGLL